MATKVQGDKTQQQQEKVKTIDNFSNGMTILNGSFQEQVELNKKLMENIGNLNSLIDRKNNELEQLIIKYNQLGQANTEAIIKIDKLKLSEVHLQVAEKKIKHYENLTEKLETNLNSVNLKTLLQEELNRLKQYLSQIKEESKNLVSNLDKQAKPTPIYQGPYSKANDKDNQNYQQANAFANQTMKNFNVNKSNINPKDVIDIGYNPNKMIRPLINDDNTNYNNQHNQQQNRQNQAHGGYSYGQFNQSHDNFYQHHSPKDQFLYSSFQGQGQIGAKEINPYHSENVDPYKEFIEKPKDITQMPDITKSFTQFINPPTMEINLMNNSEKYRNHNNMINSQAHQFSPYQQMQDPMEQQKQVRFHNNLRGADFLRQIQSPHQKSLNKSMQNMGYNAAGTNDRYREFNNEPDTNRTGYKTMNNLKQSYQDHYGHYQNDQYENYHRKHREDHDQSRDSSYEYRDDKHNNHYRDNQRNNPNRTSYETSGKDKYGETARYKDDHHGDRYRRKGDKDHMRDSREREYKDERDHYDSKYDKGKKRLSQSQSKFSKSTDGHEYENERVDTKERERREEESKNKIDEVEFSKFVRNSEQYKKTYQFFSENRAKLEPEAYIEVVNYLTLFNKKELSRAQAFNAIFEVLTPYRTIQENFRILFPQKEY